jgi:hypothetical protein
MTTTPVTLERIDCAIDVTVEAMTLHTDLAEQILPKLKHLETERDKLVSEGDPLEYAKDLLARIKVA